MWAFLIRQKTVPQPGRAGRRGHPALVVVVDGLFLPPCPAWAEAVPLPGVLPFFIVWGGRLSEPQAGRRAGYYLPQ